MKKYVPFFAILILTFCGGEKKNVSSSANLDKEQGLQHEQAGQTHTEGENEELFLLPQRQEEWGIVLGSVTEENITSTITLPGVLTLNQNKTAHISSFVPGKVASLSADLGVHVRKGKVLATINSPDFVRAQASFLETRAKLNLSRKDYERAKLLRKEKAIEEKEYLRREAEHEKLSMEYGALESILHSYGIDHSKIEELIKKCETQWEAGMLCELADPNLAVLSPIEGTIIYRDIVIGEHVEPNKILFTASDLGTLWAILNAYEKDLPYISPKSKVAIVTAVYPEKTFTGRIAHISDLVDEKLRTIEIRVEVKNPERLLKPNMYIRGHIENKDEKMKLLSVPDEAIQNLNGEKIVFILEKENVFAVRHVELGEKVGKMRIITKGLKEGDKIVEKGGFNLKADLSKATFGKAHVH